MYRRYYSYNDMPTLPQKKSPEIKEEKPLPPAEKKKSSNSLFKGTNLFDRFQADDLILLIVIFVLLADDCDDTLLLLALAFIFFN